MELKDHWDEAYQMGFNDGVKAARAVVEALEPRLDIEKHKGGYDCCGCTTPAALYVDVLDALREVQP